MDDIREFDTVRVVQLVGSPESHLAVSFAQRAPAIGDEGTVLELPSVNFNGQTMGFIVESTEGGAKCVWLAEFSRDELEVVFRPPSKSAAV